MRTVQHENKLLSEAVQSLFLQIFETWSDQALSTKLCAHGSLSSEQEVGLETTQGPFQAQFSSDSVLQSYILILVMVCAGMSGFTACVEDEICSLQQYWRSCDHTSHMCSLNYCLCSCNNGVGVLLSGALTSVA